MKNTDYETSSAAFDDRGATEAMKRKKRLASETSFKRFGTCTSSILRIHIMEESSAIICFYVLFILETVKRHQSNRNVVLSAMKMVLLHLRDLGYTSSAFLISRDNQ